LVIFLEVRDVAEAILFNAGLRLSFSETVRPGYRGCFAAALLASSVFSAFAQSPTPAANPGPGNNAINKPDTTNPGECSVG
jgi:hypothetical protein